MTEPKPLTALALLIQLAEAHAALWSVEKPCQKASRSELRRWILNGSVEINYVCDRDPFEIIDYPVFSVVIHPNSTGGDRKNGKSRGRRTTLWYNNLEGK